jgi:hypothetical protein
VKNDPKQTNPEAGCCNALAPSVALHMRDSHIRDLWNIGTGSVSMLRIPFVDCFGSRLTLFHEI